MKVLRRFRTTEMARNWSHLEVRAMIRVLWAKNMCASAMSRQHETKLRHSFQSGRQDVENHNMTGSGRPSSSTTKINTARIEEMIQNYRRVNLHEILSELGLSYGTVQHIVSDVLRYSKAICEIIRGDLAQWTGT
ncbi:histone-lysine N-methyltransferase SETMAR [Trichonephila clavipes]|nr:histone-lysine N-methyltransferase SETMAR [Trichonephila clavipes]